MPFCTATCTPLNFLFFSLPWASFRICASSLEESSAAAHAAGGTVRVTSGDASTAAAIMVRKKRILFLLTQRGEGGALTQSRGFSRKSSDPKPTTPRFHL